MSFELLLLISDRVGVFVFALSGGIVAIRKGMDLFGIIVLSFLPAIGGGTLRDLILDQPVFWLADHAALGLAALGGLTTFVFYGRVASFRPLRWADAFGMSVFAVAGAAKALAAGHGWPVVLIMAVMTASFGGLLRDVVANEEPLLLKQDVYATAALLGGVVYYCCDAVALSNWLAFALAGVCAFMLRGVAIIYGLSLPKSPYSKMK
ncbi:MAG: trimeric intracellular cation channel family protein [Pseudomonadota bacterium]